GGNTFVTTCNSANDVGVDRPWLATYGDPLTSGREYMTVDEIEQCDPDNCGLGQVGSNMLELTQASGAGALTQTFSPLPGQQVEPDGIVGGAVVNQQNGDLYLVHTAFTDANGNIVGGSDGNGNDNASVVDERRDEVDEADRGVDARLRADDERLPVGGCVLVGPHRHRLVRHADARVLPRRSLRRRLHRRVLERVHVTEPRRDEREPAL